jgi:glycosyltransferase involved in cell wall biosynthesis
MPNPPPNKRLLLVSNDVLHYRVSLYNYFWNRFRQEGWDFEVVTNRLQNRDAGAPLFPCQEIPFTFAGYRQAILRRKPDAVILFLHLKDRIFLPLAHWLKWKRIPMAFWTKTRNLDAGKSRLRGLLFDYMMWLHDGLILYSADLLRNVPRRARHKAFPANNTINFDDFPPVPESKEEIKRQFNIPFDKVVLFAGRMNVDGGRKRVDHLIEIFRDVKGSKTGLVIVGSGMQESCKARINPQSTVFLGEVHDPQNLQISRIFKMADVFAMPGHVGLGLNQAFYFGLPVVTEEGNHPPEIAYLKPGRNGFMVPANDLAALRARIFELLDDDVLRAKFSRDARNDILAEASTEGMFKGFLNCVRFLDQGRRGHASPDFRLLASADADGLPRS